MRLKFLFISTYDPTLMYVMRINKVSDNRAMFEGRRSVAEE